MSEAVVEATKQGYLLVKGDVYEEVNPAMMLFNAVQRKHEDHKKQMDLFQMLENQNDQSLDGLK